MKKPFLFLLALVAGATVLWASNTKVGDFWYNFDDINLTAEVTFQGDNPEENDDEYTGELEIPAIVVYNDKTYSVTSIGYGAFRACSDLHSITIPNSVTSIGVSAFRDCDGLTSINIPNSVTSLGDEAFYDCNYLETITIGNGVTRIENSAFVYCMALTSITIPNNVTSIGPYAFYYCTELTTVNLGNSVASIEDFAFARCSSLYAIDFPNSLTNIGEGAFSYSAVVTVTIPDNVTSIGTYAFGFCDTLTSVTIGNGVTSISEYVFGYCDTLMTVIIGSGVTSIEENAFNNCNELKDVYVSWNDLEGVSIDENAFSDIYYIGGVNLHVPAEAWNPYYSGHEVWGDFSPVYVCADNVSHTSFLTYHKEAMGDIDFELGRTLYKDGKYNTLCLPFDVSAEELADEDYPLYGATLKELESAEVSGGALYLTLTDATSIEAGKPYLINWESNENLVNPVFENVLILEDVPLPVEGGALNFVGTFDPITFNAADAEKTLFLGGDNRFHWPTAGSTLRGFRAYFEISDTPAGAPAQRGMTVRIVERPNTTTGGAHVQGDEVQSTKVLRDGQIVIIRNGKEYNALGQRTL